MKTMLLAVAPWRALTLLPSSTSAAPCPEFANEAAAQAAGSG